jgi:NADPH-dependent curcumin reductase CurA
LALESIRRSQIALTMLVNQQPQDSRSLMVIEGVLRGLEQAGDELHRVLRAGRIQARRLSGTGVESAPLNFTPDSM